MGRVTSPRESARLAGRKADFATSAGPVPAGIVRREPPQDVADLVARARSGEHRAVARLISLVETDSAAGRALLRDVAAALAPYTGRAHVVGLTGPARASASRRRPPRWSPHCARRGRRVGVIAVDPSSPFSGGALLGDRVRMGEHATDEGVFIRSMASRGHLGGLAWSTPAGAAGARRRGVRRGAGRDRRRRAVRGRGGRAGRHHGRAARTRDGRRRAGGEGRDPRGRRHPRGEQGGPRRCPADRARPRVRDRDVRARQSARHGVDAGPSCRRSRCGGEGVDDLVAALDAHRGVARRDRCAGRPQAGAGAPPRSRRSRWSRCGSGSATSAAPVRCPGSPTGWRRASSIPTAPPTRCWRPHFRRRVRDRRGGAARAVSRCGWRARARPARAGRPRRRDRRR